MKDYDNYCMITEADAEVIIDILKEYPQHIKWTIKGVLLTELAQRLTAQLKRTRDANSAELSKS